MGRLKSKVVRHLVLQGFDLSGVKFDDPTAVGADHMIVMLVIEVVLVICLIVAESNFASETRLG